MECGYDGRTISFNVIGLNGAYFKGGPRYCVGGLGDFYVCGCGY